MTTRTTRRQSELQREFLRLHAVERTIFGIIADRIEDGRRPNPPHLVALFTTNRQAILRICHEWAGR